MSPLSDVRTWVARTYQFSGLSVCLQTYMQREISSLWPSSAELFHDDQIKLLFAFNHTPLQSFPFATAVSSVYRLRRNSAMRSPMITHGAMVLPVATRGMIDPSAIRRFSIP